MARGLENDLVLQLLLPSGELMSAKIVPAVTGP